MKVATAVTAAAVLLCLSTSARAEAYFVSQPGNDGPGTLRWAIESSNALAGPHEIIIGVSAVTLSSCLPPLLRSTELRKFSSNEGAAIIDVSLVPASAYCWGLSLGGYGQSGGQTFVVTGVHVRGGWGGIWVQDNHLTLRDSVVETRSFAPGSYGGGALNAYHSTLVVERSTIKAGSGYVGAGVAFDGGALSISDSRVSGNVAYWGGGVYVRTSAASSISRTTIDGNRADLGAGIFHEPAAPGATLLLENVTLSGNQAGTAGGGLQHQDPFAGGTPAQPRLRLRHVTAYLNQAPTAAGLRTSSGSLAIDNSILGGDCGFLGGAAATGSNNLSSGGCAIAGSANLVASDLRLGALTPRGAGSLPLHSPLSHSPALGLGRACASLDGNGSTRLLGRCDAGAVEDETLGEQRTLVVTLQFSGALCHQGDSPARSADHLAHLDAFISENSYGKTSVVGQVIGPFAVDGTGCDPDNGLSGSQQNAQALLAKALTLAQGQVDLTQFERLIIAHNATLGCACPDNNHASFGFVAPSAVTPGSLYEQTGFRGSIFWQPDLGINYHILYHEFGHNLGLAHLDPLLCNDAQGARASLSSSCVYASSWGDPNHTMSNLVRPVHYAAAQKWKLGWFEPGQAPLVGYGEYDLEPLSTPGNGLKALRISTPYSFGVFGLDYVLELRKPIGLDAHVGEPTWGQVPLDGVFLFAEGRVASDQTFSLAPPPFPAGSAFQSAPLAVNTPLGDVGAGVSIRVLSVGATSARVRISPFLPDGQPCAQAADCASGQCTTSYGDGDGDGYGVAASALATCGPAPAGRVTLSGDCCDVDSRARPGQTQFFTSTTACGGFDFDCSGAATQQFPPRSTGGCTSTGMCSLRTRRCNGPYWTTANSAPACGLAASWRDCFVQPACARSSNTECGPYATLAVTQACR
ncbi:MAG: right-handed parallel beta-helix repeat-containing protein [Deltaproteobacteria bacterium]|nr:right-handed parallel beta-helix repeat-containing protein [Deltaproteobacteria bacterium]